MTDRIAVIGSGISGMSAALALSEECDVTVFEAGSRVGGHASTVDVPEPGGAVGVDTAFMVCNPTNYPLLFEMFKELGVETVPHEGGFNFFDMDSGDCFAAMRRSIPMARDLLRRKLQFGGLGMTDRIAVIGSGISGMSAALALSEECDVTVFEAGSRVGGHASTVDVPEPGGAVGVDTAFMVCNPTNYPLLFEMFKELGVETVPHEGGFNFFDMDSGDCFGTPEMEMEESEVERRFSPRFLEVWREAERLHSESQRHLLEGRCFVSMREYLTENGYSKDFIEGYVTQLSCSYWSLPLDEVLNMPASTLLGFFLNHGKDGLGGKGVSWHSVKGGSKRYMEAIQKRLARPVRTGARVSALRETAEGVTLKANGETLAFDGAIVATHADQALALLAAPTEKQRALLSPFRYNRCETVLHTDASVLPCPRDRWASWNYGRFSEGGEIRAFLVYHMNQIQGLEAANDYFVSIDSPLPIAGDKVIARFDYEHPLLDMAAYRAQKDLNGINRDGPLCFAGTYFSVKTHGPDFAGFHESGCAAGREAARRLTRALGRRVPA